MPPGTRSSDPSVIHEILGSVAVARCLHAVAELGIADRLEEGPVTADELAAATGAHARSLYRVMRMLATTGIFAEDEAGRFHLTPAAAVLRSGVEGSVRNRLRLAWQDLIWATYGQLPYTVMTGEPAFDRAHGLPLFDYLAENPEANAVFDKAMALISGPEDESVAASYNFGLHDVVVDVGGGRGGMLAAVLARHPTVQGILFDQPQVVEEVDPGEVGPAGRCSIVGGDFFRFVPTGADAYVLKRIIHDWDDEPAARLLGRCAAAAQPDGRVLVVEAVIRPGNDPDPHKAQDVGMMLLTRGRERTAEEFRILFEASGLRLERIIATREGTTLSILEGAPMTRQATRQRA
ncbi:MAG: methyltransferase [bacterium]|nr:methyltransferase [bacterium]